MLLILQLEGEMMNDQMDDYEKHLKFRICSNLLLIYLDHQFCCKNVLNFYKRIHVSKEKKRKESVNQVGSY